MSLENFKPINVNFTDIFGLSKPLEKFLTVTSNAIGILYEPVHERKKTKSKVEEIKLISEAINDNISLPIKYDNQNITIDSNNIEELVKRTQQRFLFQELKKQKNIEDIMDKTYSILEQEESVSNEKVDENWINSFFNSIDNISDTDMQNIWAKILAGEIKKPNSYSLRTLEKLKTISQNEALLFEKICKLAIKCNNSMFLPNNSELLKKYNCSYSDILILEECGLLSANGFTSLHMGLSEQKNAEAIHNNNVIGIITAKNNANIDLSIGVYSFTRFGIELYSVINNTISNKEYLIDYLKQLKDQNNDRYIFNAFNINSINPNNTITYSNDIDLLN